MPIEEKEVWRIGEELSIALVYLHENKIIHRDVKTLNVFLTRDHHVKLGDMGVSKIVKNSVAVQNTRVGTPLYLSPELVKQKPYDYKIDVWAMGCILYQMCAGKAPFSGENLISLGYNIVHNQPPPLPAGYSVDLVDLVSRLLEKNPLNRPSAEEALGLIVGRRAPVSFHGVGIVSGENMRRDGMTVSHNFHSLISPQNDPEKESGNRSPHNVAPGPRRSSPWRHSPSRNKSSKALGKPESQQMPDLLSPIVLPFNPPTPLSIVPDQKDNPSQLQVKPTIVKTEGLIHQTHNKPEDVVKDRSKQNTARAEPIAQTVIPALSAVSPNQALKQLSIEQPFKLDQAVPLSANSGIQGTKQKSFQPIPQPLSVSTEDQRLEIKIQKPERNFLQKEKQAYHKPHRQIHSAQEAIRPQSGLGPRVIVQNKPVPDKMKAMEMMLKRATLNDPIHNMLKYKDQNGLAPQPINVSPTKAWPLDTSQSRPACSDVTKKERKNMSTLQTSANDFSIKEKQVRMAQSRVQGHANLSKGPLEDADNGHIQGVSHPFLDPFRHLFTTGPNRPPPPKLEEESEVDVQYKLNIPKAKVRPQTASANLQVRSSTLSTTPFKPGISDFTDKKTYRIKTAVPGKRDVTEPSPLALGRPSEWEFIPRKVTIHDI